MPQKFISAKDLSKKLSKLSEHLSENGEDFFFAYNETDYYITFKMNREILDDLNGKINKKKDC